MRVARLGVHPQQRVGNARAVRAAYSSAICVLPDARHAGEADAAGLFQRELDAFDQLVAAGEERVAGRQIGHLTGTRLVDEPAMSAPEPARPGAPARGGDRARRVAAVALRKNSSPGAGSTAVERGPARVGMPQTDGARSTSRTTNCRTRSPPARARPRIARAAPIAFQDRLGVRDSRRHVARGQPRRQPAASSASQIDRGALGVGTGVADEDGAGHRLGRNGRMAKPTAREPRAETTA